MRNRLIMGAAILGVIAIAGWFAWSSAQSSIETAPTGEQIAAGAALYREYCASCHGANLEGQPDWRSRKADGRLPAPPHDETGHTWHHTDDQLFQITRFGLKPPLAPEGYESDMPSFEGVLSDAEIRSVIAYIESTWPEFIRTRRAARNNRGSQ